MAVEYRANSAAASSFGGSSYTFNRTSFHADGDILIFSGGIRAIPGEVTAPAGAVVFTQASWTVMTGFIVALVVEPGVTSWTIGVNNTTSYCGLVGGFSGHNGSLPAASAIRTELALRHAIDSGLTKPTGSLLAYSIGCQHSSKPPFTPGPGVIEQFESVTGTKGQNGAGTGGYAASIADALYVDAAYDYESAVLAVRLDPAADSGTAPLEIGSNTTISFGAGTPNSPGAGDLAELNTAAGEDPDVELWYRMWTQAITTADLDLVQGRGKLSELTWEAFDGTGPTNATYTLANILAGNFDAYITETATTLRNWGHPIFLRLFHEMNGNWYPWCVGVNGNTAQQHKDAWAYVRSIFDSVGASNVRWSWSPNISYTGSTPYADIYPGDAAVDVIAFDGYNWGDGSQYLENTTTSWKTPQEVFEPSFNEMRALNTTKPFWLGEVASAEKGGSKAEWIDTFIRWLTNQPEVEAFVWFHHNKERDWPISSTTAASDAFKTAMTYISPAVLVEPPVLPWRGLGATRSWLGVGSDTWLGVY